MMTDPGEYLEVFRRAGADSCSVHVEVGETEACVPRCVVSAWAWGSCVKPGDTVRGSRALSPPGRPVVDHDRDPGFGSQSFIADVMAKLIGGAGPSRAWRGLHVTLQSGRRHRRANGTGSRLAGARCFVAGSAVFHSPDPAETVRRIHASASAAILAGQMSDSTAVPAAGRRPAVRLQAKVCTVSDGVVAGTREDRSGAGGAERLSAEGYEVVERRVVEDGSSRWPKRSRNWRPASPV